MRGNYNGADVHDAYTALYNEVYLLEETVNNAMSYPLENRETHIANAIGKTRQVIKEAHKLIQALQREREG